VRVPIVPRQSHQDFACLLHIVQEQYAHAQQEDEHDDDASHNGARVRRGHCHRHARWTCANAAARIADAVAVCTVL